MIFCMFCTPIRSIRLTRNNGIPVMCIWNHQRIKTLPPISTHRTGNHRACLFPAAIPEIFTGLRVGFALTLIGSLLAEMFASQRGLGYLLMNGIGLHNVELIMAVTLIIVIFAAGVSSLLLHIDHRLHRRT